MNSVCRDPVDRFISAYEFAIETGIQAFVKGSRTRPGGELRGSRGEAADKVLTQNVWPWSSLIPFFAEDMRQRVGKQVESVRVWKCGTSLISHGWSDATMNF
jgi:hypothetical protein